MARERKTDSRTRRTTSVRSTRTSSERQESARNSARISQRLSDSSTATQSPSERRAARQASGGAVAQARNSLTPRRIIIIVAAIVLIVVAFRFCSSAMGVQVTINGSPYTLRGEKTVQTAADECGIPLNPGDLISIRGNVLQRHAGNPFSATVNGQEVTDVTQRLHDGDVVILGDGKDIVEEYESVVHYTDYSAARSGTGAIRIFTREGTNGSYEVRTGSISGEVVEKLIAEPVDVVCTNYNPNVGNDKVIALTFDDGPSEYTAEIFDVLKEYDAKATFFAIGTRIEDLEGGAELVRRATEEGSLVCSHTYSHAKTKSASANIADLKAEDQIEQVEKGIQVIEDALNGVDDSSNGESVSKKGEYVQASRIVRLPGGIGDPDVMINMCGLIDAEIGWNLDTGDWLEPGRDAIVEVLMMAEGGDIIRLHDGGGDRSQTIAALRVALPQLVKKGYRFVTIDELLTYPAIKP